MDTETLLIAYGVAVLVWTTYIALRVYAPRSMTGLREDELTAPYRANKPYFVGFLITNVVLFPIALVLGMIGGILRDDINRLRRGRA